MELKYAQEISRSLNITLKQVLNIEGLHTEGATIPFIARYRKEATSNLDEVMITRVIDQLKYFIDLAKRKETVIKTIEELGKLTPELKDRIEACLNATALEDIYLPYKPKRKTRATAAIAKGLEPLAQQIYLQETADLEALTSGYLNEQVASREEALQGARDIIAEWVSENEQARNLVRTLFSREAVLVSQVLPSKKEEEEA